MGQYNILHSCTRQVTMTAMSRNWLNNFCTMVGFNDWWDMKQSSWEKHVPDKVMTSLQAMRKLFKPGDLNMLGLLRHNWGELAMGKDRGNKTRPDLFKKLKPYHGVDFHESILIWHIATDLVLAKIEQEESTVEAIWAMSNYMMFLFVDRPDMLPGLTQNWLYQKTKANIVESCETSNVVTKEMQHCGQKSSRLKKTKHLAGALLQLEKEEFKPGPKAPRLIYARQIADILSNWNNEDPIDVLLDMWIDLLMYAANRCNRESHAKMLNTGGEFLTIVWLMIEHFQQLAKEQKEHSSASN